MMTTTQYTSGWHKKLKELKCKLAFSVGEPVVLTNHPKKLLESWGEEVNSES